MKIHEDSVVAVTALGSEENCLGILLLRTSVFHAYMTEHGFEMEFGQVGMSMSNGTAELFFVPVSLTCELIWVELLSDSAMVFHSGNAGCGTEDKCEDDFCQRKLKELDSITQLHEMVEEAMK